MATLTAARKADNKGGGSTVSKKSNDGKGFDVTGKLKTLFGNLKTTLIPLAVALVAVGVAVRWAKRDDKSGKPTLAFPFIAAAIAWLVPEMILLRSKDSGFGGFINASVLRMAGAFAFLLALTFDDLLGPIVEKARMGAQQTMNFVARVFWWGAELFSGKDAAIKFTSKSKALPASGANGAQQPPAAQPQSSPAQYDTFAATPPQQQIPQQAPQQQGGGGGDLAGAIFGFLGQAAQAVPGIISAFNPPTATNPGGTAGVAGVGNPYMNMAYARAA